MERNDIFPFDTIYQATMFEGVLASPPDTLTYKTREFLSKRQNNWSSIISRWKPNEMPLRSLADCVNRRGIGTNVYTLLPEEAMDAINHFLLKYGVSVPIYSFASLEDLRYTLSINRGVHYLYTSSREDAAVLGIRATVVSPDAAWPL